MQVTVVHALAAEILEWAAGARIVATIDVMSEAELGAVLEARASRVGICRRRSQDKVKSESGSEEKDRLARSHFARSEAIEARRLSPTSAFHAMV